jgi:hypothetical protein
MTRQRNEGISLPNGDGWGNSSRTSRPEKKLFKVCQDAVFPSRGRIESLVFLFFGVVAVLALVDSFSELLHVLSGGYLEQTVRALLGR